jgi:hypothetical protein
MRSLLLALALLVLAAVVSPGAGGPAKPPSLKHDLEKLRGHWKPAKGAGGASFHGDLSFTRDTLEVTYLATSEGGKGGVDVRTRSVKFALKEDGKNRLIMPLKAEEKKFRIRYRFDGDVLVIEEGMWDFPPALSLRGRWERIKGEQLP